MDLDLDDLRCFAAAATQLSFRRAARAVHLSPPAFTARIQHLETRLGVALFQRTTRRVELTAAGVRALVLAKEVMERAEALARVALDDKPLPVALTIGSRYELGMSWLLPQLDALEAERPERRVSLVFGDSEELLDRVRGGRIDACVTSARLGGAVGAGLRTSSLHREDYDFVASARLLAARPLHKADHAAAHTLVDADDGLPLFRYFLDASPASERWRFARVDLFGGIGAIRLRVLAGKGVAVLPRYLVAADVAAGRLVRVLPSRKLPHDFFRLVWRAGHDKESELMALAKELARAPIR